MAHRLLILFCHLIEIVFLDNVDGISHVFFWPLPPNQAGSGLREDLHAVSTGEYFKALALFMPVIRETHLKQVAILIHSA